MHIHIYIYIYIYVCRGTLAKKRFVSEWSFTRRPSKAQSCRSTNPSSRSTRELSWKIAALKSSIVMTLMPESRPGWSRG